MERLFEKHGFSVNDLLPFSEVKILSDIKEKKISDEMRERIISLAEAELERPLLAIPISHFVGYYHGTLPEYIPEFMERRRGAALLAVAEHIEGKGRFINRMLDLTWCMLEETVWIHPAHLSDKKIKGDPILPPLYQDGLMHDVDLRTGVTIGSLSVVYYFAKEIFDSITPVINERIIHDIREKALYPYIQRKFWWDGVSNGKVINWGTWISSNFLLTIACVESDEYIRKAVFAKVLETLNSYTRNYCFDGGCDEGPAYWGASCGCFLDCLDLLYDLSGGKINIYGEPHIRRMFEFAAKYNITDNISIAIADAGPTIAYDPKLIARMGEVTGSDVLRGFATQMKKYEQPYNFGQASPYRSLRHMYTESPADFEYKALKNVWFPNLKVGYSRECEDTSKGMFVCMCGGSNSTSHNHNDLGSVIVYYCGKPVFIDTGVGKYNKKTFGKERYTLTTHSSGYHNTVDIGGFCQSFGAAYTTRDESWDEKTGFVTMNVGGAFSAEAGIKSYIRSSGLEGGKVVITDSFDLDGEREIDIHFVTAVKPEIQKDGSILVAEGRVLRYDERLTASVEAYPPLDDVISKRWGVDELYNIHLKGKVEKASFVTTLE